MQRSFFLGRAAIVLSSCLICTLPFACSSAGSPSAESTNKSDSGGQRGSQTDAGGQGFGGEGGSSDPSSGCDESAKLVYVLTYTALYRFEPSKLQFTKVGDLNCPIVGDQRFVDSMAVGRDGTAWVRFMGDAFGDGQVFQVSTKDASCTPTSLKSKERSWGMGYASNAAGSKEETLFVSLLGSKLATLDVQTMTLAERGDITGIETGIGAASSGNSELTGTGDGRLFGLFMTSDTNATLAEVSKTNGELTNLRELDGLELAGGFAASFWGGDLWIFSSSDGATSSVTQLKLADASRHVVKTDVPFQILGAGVSTCAPTAPPK